MSSRGKRTQKIFFFFFLTIQFFFCFFRLSLRRFPLTWKAIVAEMRRFVSRWVKSLIQPRYILRFTSDPGPTPQHWKRIICCWAINSEEENLYAWPPWLSSLQPRPSPYIKCTKRLSPKSSVLTLLIEKYTIIICQNLCIMNCTFFLLLLFAGLVFASCPVQKYTLFFFLLVIENKQKWFIWPFQACVHKASGS